jgi:hypothetical protein
MPEPPPTPLAAFAREWLPLVGLALLLMVTMMTWISCSQRSDIPAAPGRYQMLLDQNGRVIVLDTATGETWLRTQHPIK